MKFIFHRNWAQTWLLLLFHFSCALLITHSTAIAEPSLRAKIRQKLSQSDEAKPGRSEGLGIFKKGKTRSAQFISIAGRKVAVWEAAKTVDSKSPLVIFSHGFKGCNIQSASLMEAISKSGFTIFAPNHLDAACNSDKSKKIDKPEFGKPAKWSDSKYNDRKDDILAVIDGLKREPKWTEKLDFSNLSLVGHSLGGYTVLGLAGGWSSWKMPGLKAVVAWSPYATPFIQSQTLGQIDIPVMYQGGTRDMGITPHLIKSGGAFDQANSPAYFVNFQDAGHFSWTEFNAKQFDLISSYTVSFLRRYALLDASINLDKVSSRVAEFRGK